MWGFGSKCAVCGARAKAAVAAPATAKLGPNAKICKVCGDRLRTEAAEAERLQVAESRDLELLHRLLATASAFIYSTAPRRVTASPPWVGTVVRLLSCCGYIYFEPGNEVHVARANTHWRAMRFLVHFLLASQKSPDSAGAEIDFGSFLKAFRAEFADREREILAKMPDESPLTDVEIAETRFAIAEPLATDLREHACVLEQPREVEPADEYVIALSKFSTVFHHYERLLPGEFARDSFSSGVKQAVRGFAFTVDPELLPLLHGKVLRRLWVKRIEGNEIRSYDFVVISNRADASRCTPAAISRWAT